MILYQSSFIILDYDPATDVLSVDWPDFQDFLIPEVEKEVQVLIDAIKHYDVKKLLIDTTKARVEIGNEQYSTFLTSFGLALKDTRLTRLARIGTSNPEREKITAQAKEAAYTDSSFAFGSFGTRQEAMDWLLS
jgi:hypothetical protein